MHAVTPTDTGAGPRCCECAMPLTEAAAWPQATTFANCPSCRVYLRVQCTAGRWSVARTGRAASFHGAPLPLVAPPQVRTDFLEASRAVARMLERQGAGVEPGMAALAEGASHA